MYHEYVSRNVRKFSGGDLHRPWPRWSCCREPVTRASRACSLHGQTAGPKARKVAAAAAACLFPVQPEAACLLEAAFDAGNLLITPHNTRALGGAAMAGQGPVNNNTACRLAAPNRQPHLAAAAAQRAAASSAFSVLGITLHARRRCGGRRQRSARAAAAGAAEAPPAAAS